MKLHDLETFVEVARRGSFSAAAEQLHLAQPAVSQRIRSLEHDLRAKLFERSTRRVELTAIGEHTLARAEAILAEVRRTETEVGMLSDGLAGRVAIGFVGTATYDLLPRITRRLRTELPDIDLQVYGEQLSPSLISGLLARDLDIAITRSPPPHPDLTVQPLRTERLVVAVPADSAWARRKRIRLSQLRDETFVMFPAHHASAMYDTVIEACRQAGFRPATTIEIRETATLATFVAAGLGVAIIPEAVRALALDGVAYLDIADSDVRTELMIATRADEQSPAVRRVAELVATERG